MLSVRNAIIAALLLFVISIVAGTISLMKPPDSDGAAIDSYGTHRDGLRAAYELLSELDVPVERGIEPPTADLPVTTTIVLWQPHDDLITNEPTYLRRLLPWIERGGRLVVSVVPKARRGASDAWNRESVPKDSTLWETLELPQVSLISASFGEIADLPDSNVSKIEDNERERSGEGVRGAMEKLVGLDKIDFTTVSASVTGSFENLKGRVETLQVPSRHVGGLVVASPHQPAGTIECPRPNHRSWTLAAAFPRGQGEIVVVAEPMLLMNASLGNSDNSVLTYDLLARPGRTVVFDEFYHGLSVRGNPLWLLTRSTYRLVALSLLSLLAIELWRRAIMIGPPLNAPAKSRRTILEYIEAMSRFLNRGRGSPPFLLQEVRSGTLRLLGEKLRLSPAVHDPAAIAALMAKRSPSEAHEFREAIQMLDTALAKGHSLSESEAIRALQRISRCL